MYEKNVETIYRKLKILKFKDAITLENCKLAYRLEHHMLPSKIMYHFNTGQKGTSLVKKHTYNTRNKKLPMMAKIHCKMYSNSYLCSSIRDYQKLNVELRQVKNLKVFSKLMKEKLLICEGTTHM